MRRFIAGTMMDIVVAGMEVHAEWLNSAKGRWEAALYRGEQKVCSVWVCYTPIGGRDPVYYAI